MAFLAPLAEAAGPLLARFGAGLVGRAAAGEAAGGAAGGEGAAPKIMKTPTMPIPSMGSNGGQKNQPLAQANSYLNADQFR